VPSPTTSTPGWPPLDLKIDLIVNFIRAKLN